MLHFLMLHGINSFNLFIYLLTYALLTINKYNAV